MRSVQACQSEAWTLATWGKVDGEDPRIQPFKCRSWRCVGECREICGACDFARISQALSEHADWTYCVLTYPKGDYPDLDRLFRAGKDHWSILRKRLVREYGKILYIQTWEIHKSGYPHVNVTISNPGVYAAASACKKKDRPPWLLRHAVESGFGKQCYGKPIRSKYWMAEYMMKLSLELNGHSQKDQTPVNAPRHFRRLRASRGLLPKRLKNDKLTGRVYKCPVWLVDELLNGMSKPEVSADYPAELLEQGSLLYEPPSSTTESETP